MRIEVEHHDNFPNQNGFKSFLKYFPTRFSVDQEYKENRRIIYAFKDGDEIEEVDNLFINAIINLKGRIGNPELWICPIPASQIERNRRRYFQFCQRISTSSNTRNGFNLISPIEDRGEIHLGASRNYDTVLSSLRFDVGVSNKKIILIDDVITTGRSFRIISRQLQRLGASAVYGIMLAKTHWLSQDLNLLEEGTVPNEEPPDVPLDLEYREDIDNFFS